MALPLPVLKSEKPVVSIFNLAQIVEVAFTKKHAMWGLLFYHFMRHSHRFSNSAKTWRFQVVDILKILSSVEGLRGLANGFGRNNESYRLSIYGSWPSWKLLVFGPIFVVFEFSVAILHYRIRENIAFHLANVCVCETFLALMPQTTNFQTWNQFQS